MLNQVLEKVLKAMRIPAGSIHVKEDDQDSLRLFVSKGLTAQDLKRYNLVSTRKAMWGEDIQQAKQPVQLDLARQPEFFGETFLESYSVFTSAPIRARGEMIGLLSVLRKADDTPSREDMGLLMTVADQIGVIVENDRLRKKAEEAAVTEERQRLSRELHDSVNQLLYSLALFARGGLHYAQSAQWNQVSRSLQDINDTAQQALKEMRLMLFEMRPDSLQQAGLVEALRYRLEAVERRAGVAAQLVAEEPLNLPPEAENELYRVAQEALNNALKHAFAKKVTVHLFPTADNKVKLEIIDDGNGFDPSTVSGGMGLNTMRERIVRLGGILSITSVKGQGTRVLAELNGYPPAVGVG